MRIRHLSIKNFRGIKQSDWTIDARTVCLIGKNDATKSTILDAIELVASPRWNPPISDSDFYNINVDNSIEIEASFDEIPDDFRSLDKFGLYLRRPEFLQSDDDEPEDGNETLLSVRLIVDRSLEPCWQVFCSRGEKTLRLNDRKKLGVSRVRQYVDRDLSWGTGSALHRVTESVEETLISELSRSAREAISSEELVELQNASKNVQSMAMHYGVKPDAEFRAAFDPEKIDISSGTLALHDGNVPVRLRGMGSKRLTTLAMQEAVTEAGTILLIDELEHGLEPFRLRQLVRNLRDATANEDGPKIGQVFFTTHSPITVVECMACELHIVRHEQGKTTVSKVPEEYQGTVRASTEAFLSRKVIVCEGPTEVGLLRAYDRKWKETHNGKEMAYIGVSTIDGTGRTVAPQRAIDLKTLGYDVLLFVDSDKPIKPAKCEVEAQRVKVVQWPDNTNSEQRIFRDLSNDKVIEIVRLAIQIIEDESIVMHALESNLSKKGLDISILQSLLADPEQTVDVRNAIATAAKTFEWFKRTDYGERLGRIVAFSTEENFSLPFFAGMKDIEEWVYQE